MQQIQCSRLEKQHSIAIDPATNKLTDALRFTDHPLLAKLTRCGRRRPHRRPARPRQPDRDGPLALALVLPILWGYRMAWQRDRSSAFGRPIPRGAWRQVPVYPLEPYVAVIAVHGHHVQLLGIQLGAFLAVDILLSRSTRRRTWRAHA